MIVNVDGGSRGNPGPAAVAAVVATPAGELIERAGEVIGEATNNIAEYRAMLLGVERAKALGARQVELIGDSELVVRQIRGEYKVKDANLARLHAEVLAALSGIENWSVRNVPREQNAEADRLVNEALDRG